MTTEAAFQAEVIGAAKLMGVAVYHTYDSRRSESGYPDLTIVGGKGVLFRELKTDRGRTTPAQKFWLNTLSASGADAAVWRPSDWPLIIRELRALGRTPIARPQPSSTELRRILARRGR